MKIFTTLLIGLLIFTSPLSAQINTQLRPDRLNYRDGNKTAGWINHDGSLFGLYNATGKTGHLLLDTEGDIILKTGDNTEHLRLLSNGRLGIGTDNPTARVGILHHATATTPHLELRETTAGDPSRIRFSNVNSANNWEFIARSDANPEFQISFSDGSQSDQLFEIDGSLKRVKIGPDPIWGTSTNTKLLIYNEDGGNQSSLGTTYDLYTRPDPSIWTRYGLYTYVSGAAEGVDISTQGQKIGLAASARSSGSTKTAVSAYAGIGTGTNYGVHTVVNGIGGAESYAIYAQASGGNGATTPPVWAGYFAGDVFTTGSYLPSDQKLKSGIRKAGSSLDRLRQLVVRTYQYEAKYQVKMGLDRRPQTGFLAQEVSALFPELTRLVKQPLVSPEAIANGEAERFLEFTGVNYVGFIPHLTGAVQEQQDQIEQQEAQLQKQQSQIEELQFLNEALMERLEQLEARLAAKDQPSSMPTDLVPLSDVRLGQNVPNPFSASSRISYYIPNSVRRAELQIADVTGRLLKKITLDTRGAGQIEVQALGLSAGQYTYSLIVDGQLSAARQMLVND